MGPVTDSGEKADVQHREGLGRKEMEVWASKELGPVFFQ